MKHFILLFLLFSVFSVDSFSSGLNLIYSERSDTTYIDCSDLNYFNGSLYWVIQQRRDIEDNNNTYEATEQYIQKYDLQSKTMASFPSIFCKDDQVLTPRLLKNDTNIITMFSDNYLKYFANTLWLAKPRKTIYSDKGELILDKTDSINGVLNFATMGNFILFGDITSYVCTLEPQMSYSDDKILNYDAKLNIKDSSIVDKVNIVDDTVYSNCQVTLVTESFNGKAYIGGNNALQGFNSSIFAQSFLIRLMDSSGHVDWEYRHPIGDKNKPSNLISMKLLHDNSVAALYYEYSTNSGKIIIISPEGNILKNFELFTPSKSYTPKTFLQNSQNKFIVAGNLRTGNTNRYWLSIFSADGIRETDYAKVLYFDSDFISEIVEKDPDTYYLSSASHQNYDAINIVNILEFTTLSSGIEETSSVTSAYWNGYSITVTGANNEEIEFAELFDITGRLVASQNGLSSGVFVPNMEIEPGAYILQLSSPKGKNAVKVMVR